MLQKALYIKDDGSNSRRVLYDAGKAPAPNARALDVTKISDEFLHDILDCYNNWKNGPLADFEKKEKEFRKENYPKLDKFFEENLSTECLEAIGEPPQVKSFKEQGLYFDDPETFLNEKSTDKI